jgi:hypothetical protein
MPNRGIQRSDTPRKKSDARQNLQSFVLVSPRCGRPFKKYFYVAKLSGRSGIPPLNQLKARRSDSVLAAYIRRAKLIKMRDFFGVNKFTFVQNTAHNRTIDPKSALRWDISLCSVGANPQPP